MKGDKVNKKSATLDGETYDVIPGEAVAASKVISDFYSILGKPKDPFTKQGQKMMEILISVWMDLYPIESSKWFEDRKEYKKNELSVTQQVQQRTGRSLASYPYPLIMMMRTIFPDIKFTDRDTCMKMVQFYPLFQMANKL